MTDILLINPNSSTATTEMMTKIANGEAPAGCRVTGRTATGGPSMIVNEQELEAAATEVLKVWREAGVARWDGVIVSAFGDPGIDLVRANARVPVVGIAEASMLAASEGRRRFGIATVTPELETEGPITSWRRTYETTEARCTTVYDSVEKPDGYNVRYRLEGVERTVRMDHDPGDRIPLEDGEVVTTRSERS